MFAPDCVKETFREHTNKIEGNDGRRALRGLERFWDPEPADDTFLTEFAFLLRDGEDVQAVHDRHLEGLFARATWTGILEGVGFRIGTFERPLDEPGETDEVFVCRRP